MSTETEFLPELDEELDFDIICDAQKDCGNVATWLAIPPRCSHHPFMCDKHRAVVIVQAGLHQKVVCDINNCGAVFCLCEVTWRHL